MWQQTFGAWAVLAGVLGVSGAEVAAGDNETCDAAFLQSPRLSVHSSSVDATTGCQTTNPCGAGKGGKQMCVNNMGTGDNIGLKMDQQVWNIDGDWIEGCQVCGRNLEAENKLCYGWYCGKVDVGVWLKRDGGACPPWDATCSNAAGSDACASQLAQGARRCSDYLLSKECDGQCSLCACSTGTGTAKEHCSGHGTCFAACSAKVCQDVHCVCDPGWMGSKCSDPVPTTTTTTMVTCNDKQVSSCSSCDEDDCMDDCFWRDGACQYRVDCGAHFATSCSECGDEFQCHGDCYWSTSTSACLDPLDASLPFSCGEKHRAATCEQCLETFEQMDPAWKAHKSAGCQGDCVYNPYYDLCQMVPATRPSDLHPDCPADLDKCTTETKDDPSSSDVEKAVTSAYQLTYGLTVFVANWFNGFGEKAGYDKQKIKTGVFWVKTIGQVGVFANILYNALTPKPVQPCSSTYSEDEFFLCIWDGIMPYVEQYVDDRLDQVETQNYQAQVFGVLTRLRELQGYIRDRFGVHDLGGLHVSEEFANHPIVNETRNATLHELESIHHHMRSTGGMFLKDNAPFSQVVFLTFWALLHTFVVFSMMGLDPATYQTEAYLHQFASMIADYVDEIQQRGKNAHAEREGMIVLKKTQECSSVTCEPDNSVWHCDNCWGSAKLVDNWSKCSWESGEMKVGRCFEDITGIETCGYPNNPPDFYKLGTCGSGKSLTHDECLAGAQQCHATYQNMVMFDADRAWFDFGVAHLPALRNAATKLSGSWPGPLHVVAASKCPAAAPTDLAWDTQTAHTMCCSKECSADMCADCTSDQMTFEEASAHCEEQGQQLCSAHELALGKCCGRACAGRLWTRSKNTAHLHASEEPCMNDLNPPEGR
mmetsp:Transcript_14117/g.38356  ORF Transcript_14117/g.38356 Transcript_14117/m.38356 type:complete len:876 (-) Transcript_14117:223-2850(-)